MRKRTFIVRLLLPALFCSSLCTAQLPAYKITISDEDLYTLTHRDPFSEEYLPATLEYEATVWNDLKIRYKGRSTRYFPKKSYRIKFPAKHLFRNARQLNLNAMYLDPSAMHEKLSYDLFEDIGALAPRASYGKLSINGKPQGLYLAVDKVDEHFLANRGRLAVSLYSAGAFFALADMTVQDTSLLREYYPKEIGDANDYSDLHELLLELNNAPDSTFAQVANRLFDLRSVYQWLAGNILTMMGDSYAKNYFLLRDDTRPERQWSVIPWDYDISFGLTGDEAVAYPKSLLNEGFGYTFPVLSGPGNVLKDRIWNTPALREELRRYADTLLQTVFTEDHMNHRIDSLAVLIRSEVQVDSARRGTYEDFLDHVDALKYFVMARRQYLLHAFIDPVHGRSDTATVRVLAANTPYHFVNDESRLMATMWFTTIEKLDSIQVESYPGALPAGFDSLHPGPYVRRYLSITPYPRSARFSARIQWMYHDLSSKDREIPPEVKKERDLRCFLQKGSSRIQIPAHINPAANTVTIEHITQKECRPSTYFILGVP